MKKNSTAKWGFGEEIKGDWPAVTLIILSFVTGALVYPYLPELVPSHWNIHGQVDNYSSRFWGAFALPMLTAGIYLLMVIVPRFDPKKENYTRFKGAYRSIKTGFTVFMLFLYAVILLNSLGYGVPVDRFVITGIGALFIIIGNIMGQLKHNYFVGVKTPWTIASEEVWRRTHRLSGRVWVASGLVSFLTGLFLGGERGFVIFAAAIAAAVIIPVAYSFIIYKKSAHNK
ncbi:MAG: SdpI family protein [Bacillota bacterium]